MHNCKKNIPNKCVSICRHAKSLRKALRAWPAARSRPRHSRPPGARPCSLYHFLLLELPLVPGILTSFPLHVMSGSFCTGVPHTSTLVACCWNAGRLSYALSPSQTKYWFGTGVPHTATRAFALWVLAFPFTSLSVSAPCISLNARPFTRTPFLEFF